MSFWRGFVGGFGWIKLFPLRPLSRHSESTPSAPLEGEQVRPDVIPSDIESDDDILDNEQIWTDPEETLDDLPTSSERSHHGPVIDVDVVDEVTRDLHDVERGLERVRQSAVHEVGPGELVNQVDELLARIRSTRNTIVPREPT
jgi:hypothetical protein